MIAIFQLIWTFGVQVGAFVIATFIWDISSSIELAIIAGTISAFFLAKFAKLPLSWIFLNALLPVAAAFLLSLEVANWIPLSLLVLSLLFFLPAILTRVPLFLTNKEMLGLIASKLPETKEFSFVDLGSGFGDLLFDLSHRFPRARFIGVEAAPLPYIVSKLRSLANENVQIKLKNIWSENLSGYDFVYAFLSPAPMPKLWEKCKGEMSAPQTLLVNSFPCPTQHKELHETADLRNRALYVYDKF